jgi:hypothetical protein
MTLAWCKPHSVYENTRPGDMAVIFGSATPSTGRRPVLYVGEWTGRWATRAYCVDPRHQRRFDCMYDTTIRPWKRNSNGGPHHLEGTIEYKKDQKRGTVLLSTNFVDLTGTPGLLPEEFRYLESIIRGYTSSTPEPGAIEALKAHFKLK